MPQVHPKSENLPEQDKDRQKAEELLLSKSADKIQLTKEGDIQNLLHELEVHQIELELQNEELQIALDTAEAAINKYTTLFDFAPAGYFTLDREGNITNLNLNGAKMLGIERGRLIHTKLKHFISPADKNTFEWFLKKTFESDLKQTCEIKLEICTQLCFIYFEGIKNDDDNNLCLLTAIDNTERHRAEKALKESEARLKVLNTTKDKFFSIIAHDLRNPFTSIIGFSSLLMSMTDKKGKEEIKKYAKIVHDSSLRAMDLLNNLMEWASLQTGKIRFNPKVMDLENVITNAIEFQLDMANQKTITIVRETNRAIIVYADEEMISTTLRNLISNAIKFTKPGGEINISAHISKDEVIVVVCDTGVGIDKNRIDRLFRIDDNFSTRGTQNEEGTGLGLILCKEFILRHKGKIWVESTPGDGSKFFFSIPNRVKN